MNLFCYFHQTEHATFKRRQEEERQKLENDIRDFQKTKAAVESYMLSTQTSQKSTTMPPTATRK